MSEMLADVCLAMANDIIEMTTGNRTKRHSKEAHTVAEFIYNCSTKGALRWEWIRSGYADKADQSTDNPTP